MRELPLVFKAAMDAAAKADTPEKKLEILQAAMTLEGRKTRFIISWCLAFLKFDSLFLGYTKDTNLPKFYDRTLKHEYVHEIDGSGLIRALSICEILADWHGGMLMMEHPEAGLDERHLAPLTELLVKVTKSLNDEKVDFPWQNDLLSWIKDGCPKDFEKYLPDPDKKG